MTELSAWTTSHARRQPARWAAGGGVFMPMWQAEALWINFHSAYPMAVQIATGALDALTGETAHTHLGAAPQNYLVLPEQPWLDGFCVQRGLIRQFVAMPLGAGHSAEEQRLPQAEGGLRIRVRPMRAEAYAEYRASQPCHFATRVMVCESEMALAPGGLMRQEIYADPHGLDAWSTEARASARIQLLNSHQYRAVTGAEPPTRPPGAQDYARAGLPWFEVYADPLQPLPGSPRLAGLRSVGLP